MQKASPPMARSSAQDAVIPESRGLAMKVIVFQGRTVPCHRSAHRLPRSYGSAPFWCAPGLVESDETFKVEEGCAASACGLRRAATPGRSCPVAHSTI